MKTRAAMTLKAARIIAIIVMTVSFACACAWGIAAYIVWADINESAHYVVRAFSWLGLCAIGSGMEQIVTIMLENMRNAESAREAERDRRMTSMDVW